MNASTREERVPPSDTAASHAALRESEAAQRLLVSLHDATRGLCDPADVLWEIISRVGRHFQVSRCSYGEIEPDGEHVTITRDFVVGVVSVAGRHRLEDFGPDIIRELRAGRTLTVADVRLDARTSEQATLMAFELIEARAGLIVPLVKEGRFTAIFGLQHHAPREWSPEDAALVEQIAERTWFLLGAARAQEELRRANEELSRADRRKDEFLATLAHELRNPLAPIRHAVQVMRLKGALEPDLAMARDVIERQVRQMARLVDDLLDAARITHGVVTLRRERIDLASVVEGALEASRPLFSAAGQHLTVALPGGPLPLDADPTRLVQILGNLLANASKYTPRGGAIRLSAERQGAEVVVIVRDTGIGIDAEHLPRLFTMFSHVAPPLERPQGGLGIGLALARGLVELHGGSIEARSEGAGKGSELLVRLPLAPAEADAPKAAAAPGDAAAAPGVAASAGGRRLEVLVVDDNADHREVMTVMLSLLGHGAHEARDGVEAIEAAAARRPDVILLDIGLPRMNGYEAARHIRGQPWGREVLLVALTGWGRDEDRRRATEAGFDHHLTKPVDPERLEALLRDALTARAAPPR